MECIYARKTSTRSVYDLEFQEKHCQLEKTRVIHSFPHCREHIYTLYSSTGSVSMVMFSKKGAYTPLETKKNLKIPRYKAWNWRLGFSKTTWKNRDRKKSKNNRKQRASNKKGPKTNLKETHPSELANSI